MAMLLERSPEQICLCPIPDRGDLELAAVPFVSFVAPHSLPLQVMLSAGAEPFSGALCAPRQGHCAQLKPCHFTALDVLRLQTRLLGLSLINIRYYLLRTDLTLLQTVLHIINFV